MSIAILHRLTPPVSGLYQDFLSALREAGFAGEISARDADRTVLSTDNSLYQRLPQAVVCPAHVEDVMLLGRLLGEARHREIKVAPRGGGTGTNGQSLTDGIVVDLSRHMNAILEINVQERWVRVQAGVVKDQLNAALKAHGLFFAPELSTSNRATVGGMINTDASGQGSCTYGKTRDHILDLEMVLLGGERFSSHCLAAGDVAPWLQRPGRAGDLFRTAHRISHDQAALIRDKFPPLNRCLTGYDLAHLQQDDGGFNLNSVLCGSEGSLGFVVEARLNVLPVPAHSTLVNISYASFMDALHDARALIRKRPLSIETVDSRVLQLAMKDIVWNDVGDYFPQESAAPVQGINLVEFSGDDADALEREVAAFVQYLRSDRTVTRLGHTIASGNDAVKRVYAMRKRAVGLLGNVQGEARPQPFVEDTAVPPERLPDYIAEFRALLDSYGLQYGMFGHVDAGVLHVRPALDMKDPAQAALVRPISAAVAALTRKHGGLLWGEHGKGVRSEYAPAFFGELYPALQEIKQSCDPYNQLNPGKIATSPATGQPLLKIDGVPTRGQHDRQIDERVWQSYGAAMHCNGNGACYNYDTDDAMCPSWKATRDRVHSPKGRSSLMREWLRQQDVAGGDVLLAAKAVDNSEESLLSEARKLRRSEHAEDFSHEVYDAMAGCLACKSCAGQCPVKVNVPDFRSRFLQLYHQRYRRPLRDYLVGMLEPMLPLVGRFPRVYNHVVGQTWLRGLVARWIGLVDSPALDGTDLAAVLEQWDVQPATAQSLSSLSGQERERSVVLVQDAFTRYFETSLVADFVELASRLGYRVWLAPYLPNGKPLHVHGFMGRFAKAAITNAQSLSSLAQSGVALVGIDPAMTLVYRQEYLKVEDIGDVPRVALPQEWLERVLASRPRPQAVAASYRLMAHCTEKTNAPDSTRQWKQVFAGFGLALKVEEAGCCGMSGTYGHEARNLATSKTIYAQSWERKLDAGGDELLATGYSCRSQVRRLSERALRHPVQVLLEWVRGGGERFSG